MKIIGLEPFILHVPVTGSAIADSTNAVTHWGAPGVIVHTDAGISGCGYTGTLGHLACDRLIRDCIGEVLGPLVLGQDALATASLWEQMTAYPPLKWVGRAGIAQMAIAAVDVALWDIKAKAADMPLWQLLGGNEKKRLAAYNTDGGWLNWSKQQLIDDARRAVDAGFWGVKIKIGKPDPHEDLDRIEAVRDAVGAEVNFMVDGNCAWDLPTAIHFGGRFADYDLYWFEEPLAADDVSGHAELARAIETPIAVGESLYRVSEFRRYMEARAIHHVQPDATRLGGITPWLPAAELAQSFGLPVIAHVADMMHIHAHLAFAHPACRMLEYIPWMRVCFEEPVTVEDGCFVLPRNPGAGTTFCGDTIERFGVS